jgi:hypothetical protein
MCMLSPVDPGFTHHGGDSDWLYVCCIASALAAFSLTSVVVAYLHAMLQVTERLTPGAHAILLQGNLPQATV